MKVLAAIGVGAAFGMWVVGCLVYRWVDKHTAPHETFVIRGEGIRPPGWVDQLADEAAEFLKAHH